MQNSGPDPFITLNLTRTAMRRALRHSHLWFVAVIACMMPLSGRCYEFEVTGRLYVSNYFRGSTLSTQFYEFQISVSNQLWHLSAVDYNLRTTPAVEKERGPIMRSPQPDQSLQNNQRRLSLTLLAGTDARSVYGFSTLQNEKGKPTLQGFVTQGPKPQFNRHLQSIWMAFASSEYLNYPPNLSMLQPPWDTHPTENKNYSLKADIERDSSLPDLPLQILFYRISARGGSVGDSGEALIGRYGVLSRTNYAGLSIPTSCLFERFSTPATNRLLSSYLLQVVAVRKPSITAYVPQPIRSMLVLDYRFKDISLGYDITPYYVQDGWRSDDDQELARMAESRKKSLRDAAQSSGRSAPGRRKVVIVVLATTLVLPAILYFNRTIKHRTNTI